MTTKSTLQKPKTTRQCNCERCRKIRTRMGKLKLGIRGFAQDMTLQKCCKPLCECRHER